MPNILIKIPFGSYGGAARAKLLQHVTDAAATAEQIPANPQNRLTTWVAIEEVQDGHLACAGLDMTAQILPCIAIAYVPAGVLDGPGRARYVQLVHQAFQNALPATEKRQLMTSVIVNDVAEGTWGGNGSLMTLSGLARLAGYAHLQHLATAA